MSDYLRSTGSPTLHELSAVNLVLEPTMAALAHIHSLGMIHRLAGQPPENGRINTPCLHDQPPLSALQLNLWCHCRCDRDLKLENILLGHSLQIKLADFGCSIHLKGNDKASTRYCRLGEQHLG